MKKIIATVVAISAFTSLYVNAAAYTFNGHDKYTIELPEKYIQSGVDSFIADNANFNVSIEEKEEKNYCIENLSNEKLLKQAKEEAEKASEAFTALGKKGGTEVVSCEKIKHPDGKTACVTVYKTSMEKSGKTVSHLQKTYEFSCKTNNYSFVYTPSNDKDIDAFDEAFNSIKIIEPDAKSTVDKLTESIPLVIIFFLIILGIFKFIRGKKN